MKTYIVDIIGQEDIINIIGQEDNSYYWIRRQLVVVIAQE